MTPYALTKSSDLKTLIIVTREGKEQLQSLTLHNSLPSLNCVVKGVTPETDKRGAGAKLPLT